MDREKPFVVACIPAFEEESSIARVILTVRKHVDKVLVCDDGSFDMTGEIAEGLGATVLRHERNLGKGEAIKSLFDEALKLDPDVLVMLDGDGQHDAYEIPMLIKPILASEADMVVGSRYVEGASMDAPLYRRIGLKAFNSMRRRFNGIPVSDAECGFKALSKKALACVCGFETSGYGADAEIIALAAKSGVHIAERPVKIRYQGLKRTSKKAPLSQGGELVKSIVQLMIEDRPLKYLGLPGILFLLFALLLVGYQAMIFNTTQTFSIHVMVAIFGVASVGFTLVVSSLLLYALKMIKERITDLKKH
jgi:glycosyltransferase involved in cell wall biosynthesis